MEKHKITQLDRIARYADLIQKQAGKAVRPYRADGYVNMMTRYGTQKDASEQYKFVPEDAIPDELLTMYYEGNGLFAKIIDTPAEEAIKHGFELKDVSDQTVEDFYTEALDELDWEETAMTAIKWARLFGGSLAVMLINDGRGLDEPLDWRHIQSIDDIRVFDRSVIQPDYTTLFNYDPRDPFSTRGSRLGLPEYYQIFSKYGSFTVHDSRCLVFQNGILPENTTNSIYQLWGVPEYIRLHRAIRDAEVAHRSAPKMLDRSVQPIYKMQNLAAELATEEGESKVLRRLQVIDMARGLLNSLVIDAEGEDYDFKTFQFSGINDVVSASCNMLSALSNIPQTILFGQAVGGMSSTDDTSMENYYNYVERIQRRMLKSNLRYLLSIIFQAGLATGEVDEVPKIKIKFNPLWSLSDVEQADLEQKWEQTKFTRAQTAQIYVNMQAIDPSEVRQKLADSEEFDVEAMLDEYDDDELFPDQIAGETPVDTQGQPVQSETGTGIFEEGDFAEYGQDVSVEEHNADPETGGNAPAAAPAATKLPQDMSDAEKQKAGLHGDTGDSTREIRLYMPGSAWDADAGGWITVNGTHVLTNEKGEITGGPDNLKRASAVRKQKKTKSRSSKTVKGFKHQTKDQLKSMPMSTLKQKTKDLAMWSYTHGKMSQWNTRDPKNGELDLFLSSLLVNASRNSMMKDYLSFQRDYEATQKNADSTESVINPTTPEKRSSVGVLVISDGKVLSGTRHNDFGYGLVCGPGGHVEPGETPTQAAFRETEEEFGISPKELIPLGLGPYEPDTGLRPHLYLCTEYEGEPNCLDLEMSGARFRTMEELDELAASMFQPFADGLKILKTCIDTALFFGDDEGEMHDDLVSSVGKAVVGDPEKEDGGPGSGNHGHEGVAGKVGGSAPKGSNVGGEKHKPISERTSPAIKSPNNFENYVKENGLKPIYRGISAPSSKELNKYSDMMKRGESPDSGDKTSALGSGVYFTDDKTEANGYATRRKEETGDADGKVITCALDKDAKVMSLRELESAKQERIEQLNAEIKAVRRTATEEELDALYDERDEIFSMKAADYGRHIGCDAMYDPFTKYTVVVNQNALVIRDDENEDGADAPAGTETNIPENPIDKSAQKDTVKYQVSTEDGGPGSGNHGHKGVPGEIGGSAPASAISSKESAGSLLQKINTSRSGTLIRVSTNGKSLFSNGGSDSELRVVRNKHSVEKLVDTKTGKEYTTADVLMQVVQSQSNDFDLLVNESDCPESVKSYTGGEGIFASESFSSERKENAKKCYSAAESEIAYGDVAKNVSEIASPDQKYAAFMYLANSTSINGLLRGEKLNPGLEEMCKKTSDDLSALIDKSSYDADVYVQRGVTTEGLSAMLGCNASVLTSGDISTIKNEIVGSEYTDRAFTSTGAAIGTGLTDRNVQMRIYCPKGTKMLYLNRVTGADDEAQNEMLIQRGTSYRVTGIEQLNDGKLMVDAEVIGQIGANGA